ncbi:DHA14-like major facilitator efflux transporter (MFS transporter) [Venturia nashicola]|nr:DHA14-like major facilitator efflux transporter (MFS transporter) [Venturia nashicola]
MQRPRSSSQPSSILPSIPEASSQPQRPSRLSTRWDPAMDPPRQNSYEIFSPIKASSYGSKLQNIETEDSANPAQPEKEQKAPSKLLVMSLFVSVFLAAVDITIITTALPTIAEDMRTNNTGFVWIGSSYLLASAASEPVWAKTSDIFGRKPILMLANSTFLAGSVICALAKGMTTLIAGRVVQGLGSGGLLVLVNILLGDLFNRGVYYGLLGLVWSVANAIGPFLGGLFSTKMDWRWCFWVNIPIDGIALILTAVFLKVHNPVTPFWQGIKAMDWLGCITVVGGTVLLLIGIEFGGVTYPWDSGPVISLISGGIVMWFIFFYIEARVAKYPLVPMRIVRSFSNLCILAIGSSHAFVMIAGSYFLPVYFQGVLGANALLSGVYLFPFALSNSLTSIVSGFIIKKTGDYQSLITGGMLCLALGFALFIDLPEYSSWSRIIIYQIIAGIGVGPNFQCPLMALQNSVAPHDIGAASGTFGFVRQLSNAISVVLGGVVLQGQLKGHRKEMIDGGVELRVVNLMTGGSAISSVHEINRLPTFARQVARKAFSQSLSKLWIMYACFAIVGLGLTNFIQKYELSTEHKQTVTGLEEQERIRKQEAELRTARKTKKGTGIRPDPERSPQKPEQGYGGQDERDAEVLGLSLPDRAPTRNMRADMDERRTGFPPRKEGAITAARRRANLAKIGASIAEGQHPVSPLQADMQLASRSGEFHREFDQFYQEEDSWNDSVSEEAVDLGLDRVTKDEIIKASRRTSLSEVRHSLKRDSLKRMSGNKKKGDGWGPLL